MDAADQERIAQTLEEAHEFGCHADGCSRRRSLSLVRESFLAPRHWESLPASWNPEEIPGKEARDGNLAPAKEHAYAEYRESMPPGASTAGRIARAKRLMESAEALAKRGETRLPTGWGAIDAVLGGGLPAGVHEWLGVAGGAERGEPWTPPLRFVAHLAAQGLARGHGVALAAWIGPAAFAYPVALAEESRRLVEQSIFIWPPTDAARLWAIDLTIRSPASAVVVADGSRLDRVATQRLQLLAAARDKPVLLVRPAAERRTLSAAASRWLVSWAGEAAAESLSPRWKVQLLRCKGIQPGRSHEWLFEQNDDARGFHLSAAVADLPGTSKAGDGPWVRAADGFQPRRAVGGLRV
ncbi:MAG: hypothetical protein IT450_19130 [Phycisphaerales bacterium]|nr:hypothetical protein [Phycisphaerales bacterium]